MQTAVKRLMKTYGMMVNLTVAQAKEARERLGAFLRHKTGSDHELAPQGLQFLRGTRSLKRRTICRINSAASESLLDLLNHLDDLSAVFLESLRRISDERAAAGAESNDGSLPRNAVPPEPYSTASPLGSESYRRGVSLGRTLSRFRSC